MRLLLALAAGGLLLSACAPISAVAVDAALCLAVPEVCP